LKQGSEDPSGDRKHYHGKKEETADIASPHGETRTAYTTKIGENTPSPLFLFG
jgi:hypothetical protein